MRREPLRRSQMQALASERPLAREAGWDQKPSGESRLGYDGNEGIYFDRTKAADEIGEDGQPLFEECEPEEVCAELEAERDALDTRLKQAIGHIDDMTAALTRANLQPQEPESLHEGLDDTPPRVENPPKVDAPLFTLKDVQKAVASALNASKRRGPVAQEVGGPESPTDDEATHEVADASACISKFPSCGAGEEGGQPGEKGARLEFRLSPAACRILRLEYVGYGDHLGSRVLRALIAAVISRGDRRS